MRKVSFSVSVYYFIKENCTSMTSTDQFNATFLGLVNFEGKYLTAEKFGNQINVTGTSLRSKQMWCFEQTETSTKVYLKSPNSNYLETTKTGDALCESKEKSNNFIFDVDINEEGQWTFKDCFGKYLCGNSERLYTQPKVLDEALWSIHIASHPQCCILSISRKRYVVSENGELCANEDVAWGQNAVITVEYQCGKYALRDSSGKYLNGNTGKLDDKFSKDSWFTIHIYGNMYGLRSSNGKYLTTHGPNGKLIASKQVVGKDEQFIFNESKAQCLLLANNGKKLSIRQGIDVTANQFLEPEDTETFQIDFCNGEIDKVTFLARTAKFWRASDKSITATATEITVNSVFKLEWNSEKVALKSFNGKYLVSSSGGQLSPVGESPSDVNALFTLVLVNRPIIVFRGENGYIGMISSTNKIQCNRGIHDAMQVLECAGKYRLKTVFGKFWKIDADFCLIADEGNGDLFHFQLYGKNKMMICAENGKFLQGDNNGVIKAIGTAAISSTLWEY
ncbi:fascin isoform X1 [Hydra vulgaris]|uniref:fascin isoform X1 n=1 Tax=Hydra vulgaris TaxID=6087 RepID=UPI001F5FB3A0|nr:fascin isoform X1 [Hydra vulgaris]